MSCGALILHSLALIAHATFLAPLVVALPCFPVNLFWKLQCNQKYGSRDLRTSGTVCVSEIGIGLQPLSVGVHAQRAANAELAAAAKTQEYLATDADIARSRVIRRYAPSASVC